MAFELVLQGNKEGRKLGADCEDHLVFFFDLRAGLLMVLVLMMWASLALVVMIRVVWVLLVCGVRR
jgi:hypothetical protein